MFNEPVWDIDTRSKPDDKKVNVKRGLYINKPSLLTHQLPEGDRVAGYQVVQY